MADKKKQNPLWSLLVNILIPVLILTKLSGPDELGTLWALIVAFSIPVSYGLYRLIKDKTYDLFSILGVVSVLLTGGIGVLALDNRILALKEAGVPLLIGLALLITQYSERPLVRAFFAQMIDLDTINKAFKKKGHEDMFEDELRFAGFIVAGAFFISAILNYVLARVIVTSVPGSEAYNAEIARMTALSFPVIAVPTVIIIGFVLWYLVRSIERNTGLRLEDVMKQNA